MLPVIVLCFLHSLYPETHAELNPYCALKCENLPNTMCQYNKGGTPMCGTFINGLTDQQKDLVLKTHNTLRQKVALGQEVSQPSAANMMVLIWDDEGAKIAQRWAEQCEQSFSETVQKGDKCRTKLDGEEGGQNWSVEAPDKSIKDFIHYFLRRISQWYLEGRALGYKWSEAYYHNPKLNSYTQMAWATTKSVGCGFSYNNSETDSLYRFVCNYYPKGNVIGGVIYMKGLACSKCPEGTGCSKTWPGLCTDKTSDMGGKLPPNAVNTEALGNTIISSWVVVTVCASSLVIFYI